MNQCKEILNQIAFYLDDELEAGERTELDAHLRGCESCREIFERQQRFLESVRDCSPLYSAPAELRARVEEMLSAAPSPHTTPPGLRHRIQRSLRLTVSRPNRHINARVGVALLALVLLIGWGIVEYMKSLPNPPSHFAMMAVDTHQRHQKGQLPLEIGSDVPEEISNWFAGKVPFSVKLPNYQESSGQEKLYSLEGARLVGYNNGYAAYVAYQMQNRPISLVVTSESTAQPWGGEEIASRGLTFHYDSIEGLKVITWSDRGLTYALVSDLEERGQQSCIVCHQGTKDQDFIEGLKPKQSARFLMPWR
jgi:mycothiol system anti-sigma-R factor